MWKLDCEESLAPKTWCFWTVVLEKTLESPMDCKEIQPVHSKVDQSWVFFGRNDAKAETPVLWKRLWCWEGLGAGGKGDSEDETAGWHHRIWVNSRSWWCRGKSACCNSWGHKELDTTEGLNWTELNWKSRFSDFSTFYHTDEKANV